MARQLTLTKTTSNTSSNANLTAVCAAGLLAVSPQSFFDSVERDIESVFKMPKIFKESREWMDSVFKETAALADKTPTRGNSYQMRTETYVESGPDGVKKSFMQQKKQTQDGEVLKDKKLEVESENGAYNARYQNAVTQRDVGISKGKDGNRVAREGGVETEWQSPHEKVESFIHKKKLVATSA
eukprot:Blabericola_migrator_1__4653@NODE_2463_length_2722_cov_816_590960_g1541_i0_p2_GENE_NODE_2463_length_2722_cov_816_590960_g1541_i0NODE_2463_length_2722_cov_816_590960_g1541_i0_p2_ORF_typecomplete_len184_score44_19DUF4298/PF14131_6/1_8e03DUF4298/PF14131_6/0_27_NODE_2463_length_2722_cov_816_590960_g1541_i089640